MMFLSILKSNWKILGVILLMASSFYFGYSYNSYKNDSERLEEFEKQQRTLRELVEKESSIASLVEEKLDSLSANERVIERERLKIIESPIYNIECIDEIGQELIRKLSKGNALK
jgi:hypothetical protein